MERGKKTLMQNEQLILKNHILKYETDQLKTKPTASFTKSRHSSAEQTITDAELSFREKNSMVSVN